MAQEIQPDDELDCEAGERLFRTIYPGQQQDGVIGYWIFIDSTKDGKMSVDAERFRSEQAELEFIPPHLGIVAIPCVATVNLGQRVYWEPTSDNIAHCGVLGKKNKRVQKRLWDLREMVRELPTDGSRLSPLGD